MVWHFTMLVVLVTGCWVLSLVPFENPTDVNAPEGDSDLLGTKGELTPENTTQAVRQLEMNQMYEDAAAKAENVRVAAEAKATEAEKARVAAEQAASEANKNAVAKAKAVAKAEAARVAADNARVATEQAVADTEKAFAAKATTGMWTVLILWLILVVVAVLFALRHRSLQSLKIAAEEAAAEAKAKADRIAAEEAAAAAKAKAEAEAALGALREEHLELIAALKDTGRKYEQRKGAADILNWLSGLRKKPHRDAVTCWIRNHAKTAGVQEVVNAGVDRLIEKAQQSKGRD